jgi:hypothetical protein
VTEEDARLALLQTELNAVQNAIRSQDSIIFQIRGWCVTASLAIGGFAVAYHKAALLVIGIGATIGFFLVECQFKLVQRAFINRNYAIDSELKNTGVMEVLKGAGRLQIVGTSIPMWTEREASGSRRARVFLGGILREARLPQAFGLYLFILVCLIAEAIVLL